MQGGGRAGVQGADREYWHWTHLNIGQRLDLYGRDVLLTGCDDFTREQLASEGVELALPAERPAEDAHQQSREQLGPVGQRQQHQTKETYDGLQQFLHHDRKVSPTFL